jgi:hypothetical protein
MQGNDIWPVRKTPPHPALRVALHFGIRLLFQSLDLWDLLLIYSVNEFLKD